MPETCKRTKSRTKVKRRRRTVKGGGSLNRLPVGPGSRNEEGKPFKKYGAPKSLDFRRKVLEEKKNFNKLSNAEVKNFVEAMLPKFVQRGVVPPKNYAKLYDKAKAIPSITNLAPPKNVFNDVYSDFLNNWEFKYVIGHGILVPDSFIKVPERTYLKFASPAGTKGIIFPAMEYPPIMSFPDTFVKEDNKEFIREMTQHYFDNSGPLQSFSSLEERTTVSNDPYPESFCMPCELKHPESIINDRLTSCQRIQSFYGPGEEVQNMVINFTNRLFQFMMLGIYNLPIAPDFFNAVGKEALKVNEMKWDYREGKLPQFNKFLKTKENKLSSKNKSERELLEFMVFSSFFTKSVLNDDIPNPNLAKGIIGASKSLSKVFQLLGPVPKDKVRLVYLSACRHAPLSGNEFVIEDGKRLWKEKLFTPEERLAMAKSARRASVSLPP